MRQPLEESGPDASLGSAYTRGEVLKAATITATSAARMISPGIQMSLWLGCMAISFGARADDAWRASLQSENGRGVIPCRVSAGQRGGSRRLLCGFLQV